MSYPDLTQPDPFNKSRTLTATLLQIGPPSKPLINAKCVANALDLVTAGSAKKNQEAFRSNRFFRCNTFNEPLDHQDEPCRSVEYKSLIHTSFELTTQCLKEFVTGSRDVSLQNTWVEGYFKMLSKESGLHVNVASRIGAIGVGQLRAKYIIDFENRTLPRLRAFLNRPETTEVCKRIGKELLTNEKISRLYKMTTSTYSESKDNSSTSVVRICENIDINQDQPLLNLIISFSNLKLYKESILDGIFNDSRYNSAFKELTPTELIDLQIKMVSWSYNLGPTRLKNHIFNILDTKYSGKTITKIRDFIVDAEFEGKKNYLFAIEDRYKLVLSGQKSCRTDLK